MAMIMDVLISGLKRYVRNPQHYSVRLQICVNEVSTSFVNDLFIRTYNNYVLIIIIFKAFFT